MNKKVVLISGITNPEFEFNENCIRIINKNICHGCLSDSSCNFDKGDWMCCPKHKNTERQFECTKTITPQMVMEYIQPILK